MDMMTIKSGSQLCMILYFTIFVTENDVYRWQRVKTSHKQKHNVQETQKKTVITQTDNWVFDTFIVAILVDFTLGFFVKNHYAMF